eukprot:gene37382-46120_t
MELAYNRLLKARNNMKHILSVLTAETNKLKILRLMGLFEGDEGAYVGGGDPKPATMRAVLFYETEGGVTAKQRKGSKRYISGSSVVDINSVDTAAKKLKSIPVHIPIEEEEVETVSPLDSLSCVAFTPSEVLVPVTLSTQPTPSSDTDSADGLTASRPEEELSEQEVHELMNLDVSGWVVVVPVSGSGSSNNSE